MSPTKLTYDDFLRIPNDGKRHEIIDGEHFVNAAPNLYHQNVLGRLYVQLYTAIQLRGRGSVFLSPVDVQFSETDVVEPDLVVVLEANDGILTETRIKGVPDLVVEILSPSTARYDRTLKMRLYERFGVPEYWIVDLDGQVVERYSHIDDRFAPARREREALPFNALPDVTVDLSQVW